MITMEIDFTVKEAEAYQFARDKHNGQLRDGGELYINHPLDVYRALKCMGADENLCIAALLHDTLEDTDTTEQELFENFGRDVRNLVLEVTHEGEKDIVGHWFPRLHSQRGIMLKFADRLSNLSEMQAWREERVQQYLRKSKFWASSKEECHGYQQMTPRQREKYNETKSLF